MGAYCFCFITSVTRWPRSSCLRVASSRSEANCEKAASSRYCASARRMPPPSFLMMSVCAAPPTRDTEMPAFIAGRIPELNRSVSRKICPSVMEMTLGHERRHVPGLRLDDRQPGERAGLTGNRPLGHHRHVLLVHARAALEQPGVQIKHVPGKRLAPRRAPQQQRDLAVGYGLLGEVVIDDERVLTLVHEVLAHRDA